MTGPFKLFLPAISGHLAGFRDEGLCDANERVIDLVINTSNNAAYAPGQDHQFRLRRADLQDQDAWDDFNSRTVISGMVRPRLFGHAASPSRQWADLIGVTVSQGQGGASGIARPAMERELKNITSIKRSNFKR